MDDESTRIEEAGKLQGIWASIVRVIFSLIAAVSGVYCLGVHNYLQLTFYVEQYSAFNLALLLAVIFLAVPATKRSKRPSPPWYDLILAMGGLVVGGYIMIRYPYISLHAGFIDPFSVVLGVIALVLVFEATRRTHGWAMIIITGTLIFYGLFSDMAIIPKAFNNNPLPFRTLMHYLYTDNNALFGRPLAIIFDTVFPFLLFGNILFTLGGGELLCNFALALFGRFRGGPAKVSIVSSALFGTVSGSAAANVAVDGPITIPLMHRTGYDWATSAAIEAIASAGGQIMPPVMGVAAFLMAELLNIPYGEVALSAVVPAVLYYICLFVQVDREAAKMGMKPISKEDVPKVGPVLKEGLYFFIPFLVLIYTLFITKLEAGRAGMWASLTVIGIAFLKKKTRALLRENWMKLLEGAGQTVAVGMGAVIAVAGLVIGLTTVSGLSSILTLEIVRYAGGSLLLLLIVVAIVSLILGMGLPTGPCYILLAVTIGPAIAKLGVAPLAGHLFIFYFGIISAITPPVCIAVYAACTIAKTSVWKTGFIAMRLGITAYFIPFLFVYSPELLLKGPIVNVVLTLVTAVAGVALMGSGIVGYVVTHANWITRILAIVAGFTLVIPVGGGIPHSVLFNVGGGILGIGVCITSYLSYLREGRKASKEILLETSNV